MKRTRTIELTIEKSETLTTVQPHFPTALIWCDGCGREVRMFSPEEAAVIVRTTRRKIYQAVEAGQIHFVELPKDLLLVCLDCFQELRHDLTPLA